MPIPSLQEVQKYSVNRQGIGGYKQSLYDYQLYPTAGLNQLTFFQLPKGQGVATSPGAVVGSLKTIGDTNMEAPGNLPAGKSFLINLIEVDFYAGLSNVANTFAQAVPSVFDAVAAAAVAGQINDVSTFYNSGSLNLFVGSTTFLEEAPLNRFPPKAGVGIDTALATNSATVGELATVHAKATGKPYLVEPPLLLVSNQNFQVSLNFPGAVATPSGFNGRVGVILDGYMYRVSQ